MTPLITGLLATNVWWRGTWKLRSAVSETRSIVHGTRTCAVLRLIRGASPHLATMLVPRPACVCVRLKGRELGSGETRLFTHFQYHKRPLLILLGCLFFRDAAKSYLMSENYLWTFPWCFHRLIRLTDAFDSTLWLFAQACTCYTSP